MANPFATLPPEIFDQIILVAVVDRGIKRATRLRYVSRTWDVAVMHAIFVSRILDEVIHIGSYYWSRYLAFRTMGRPAELSRPLRIIRQVAERLAAHRSSADDHSFTDAALRGCVFEICAMMDSPYLSTFHLHHSDLSDNNVQLAPSPPINEDDKQFLQALLAAATWTNEVDLVRELLSSYHLEYLICRTGWEYAFDYHDKPILGHPLCLAASCGHEELVVLLMSSVLKEADARYHGEVKDQVLRAGFHGNQLSVLNLVLESAYPNWTETLANKLSGTTSAEVLKRMIELPGAREKLIRKRERKPDHFNSQFLPFLLSIAAGAGNIALMEYLVELGAVPRPAVRFRYYSWSTCDPVYQAAKKGRKAALVFLLERGFPWRTESLQAAVRYGDAQTVEVVLDHIDGNEVTLGDIYGELLSVALEKENGAVHRLLLSRGDPSSI